MVDKTDMKNERFEKYYKTQNILSDDEWETFMESMREPLPTTFRVAGSRQSVVLISLASFRVLIEPAGLLGC